MAGGGFDGGNSEGKVFVYVVMRGRESCPRNSRRPSQESREASLAAAQTSTQLMQPAAGCALKGRTGRTRQASRRLVCCCCCAKPTHVQHASASSTIKIWIVLAAFGHHLLPPSRHTSPLPPNAFSPPKHIPTHTLPRLLLQKPAIYAHVAAAKQNTAVPSGWRQRLQI